MARRAGLRDGRRRCWGAGLAVGRGVLRFEEENGPRSERCPDAEGGGTPGCRRGPPVEGRDGSEPGRSRTSGTASTSRTSPTAVPGRSYQLAGACRRDRHLGAADDRRCVLGERRGGWGGTVGVPPKGSEAGPDALFDPRALRRPGQLVNLYQPPPRDAGPPAPELRSDWVEVDYEEARGRRGRDGSTSRTRRRRRGSTTCGGSPIRRCGSTPSRAAWAPLGGAPFPFARGRVPGDDRASAWKSRPGAAGCAVLARPSPGRSSRRDRNPGRHAGRRLHSSPGGVVRGRDAPRFSPMPGRSGSYRRWGWRWDLSGRSTSSATGSEGPGLGAGFIGVRPSRTGRRRGPGYVALVGDSSYDQEPSRAG